MPPIFFERRTVHHAAGDVVRAADLQCVLCARAAHQSAAEGPGQLLRQPGHVVGCILFDLHGRR